MRIYIIYKILFVDYVVGSVFVVVGGVVVAAVVEVENEDTPTTRMM